MPAQNRERIDKEGTYYHIYNKGVEGRIIFNDEEDYQVFIGYLEDYLAAPKDPQSLKKVFKINGRAYRGTPHQPKNYFQKVEAVAYSLMPDHFHFILHQVISGSQEKFIRSLCTRYSMYFNKKYKRTGALFEGPYKSIPIKGDERLLSYLTYNFHHASRYSSYPEYLGKRKTSWVKPQVVLNLFKNNPDSYKYFMEKYSFKQEEKELIDSLTFDSDTQCVERRDLTSSGEIPSDNEEIRLDSKDLRSYKDLKSRLTLPLFLATSVVVFLLLVSFGVRNVQITTSNRSQSLPNTQVLSETEDATPKNQPEIKSGIPEVMPETEHNTTVTVKLDDASLSVNIREQPATDSAKIGKASDGDTFEFVSKDEKWYEVKLASGSGFISADYIREQGE